MSTKLIVASSWRAFPRHHSPRRQTSYTWIWLDHCLRSSLVLLLRMVQFEQWNVFCYGTLWFELLWKYTYWYIVRYFLLMGWDRDENTCLLKFFFMLKRIYCAINSLGTRTEVGIVYISCQYLDSFLNKMIFF